MYVTVGVCDCGCGEGPKSSLICAICFNGAVIASEPSVFVSWNKLTSGTSAPEKLEVINITSYPLSQQQEEE